ncbi:MAG: zf-TFIIB domain-containing protein [Ignavibacteriaceae bacterium]
MHCPKDKTEMKQITKEDVVIDFCPTCRGVFLDRGELDKIINRSHEYYTSGEEAEVEANIKNEAEGNKPDYPDLNNRTGSTKPRRPYKTGSNFLGALFDLDEPGVEGNRGFLGGKR